MTARLDSLHALDDFTIEVPELGLRQLRHPVQGVLHAGVPRNPFEKIADAAQVHAVTGLAPRVSLHIPWDRVDDFGALTPARQGARRVGSARSTPTCSRTTTTGWAR